ncbi:MAG: HEAT repeat domain-containing protein [Actinomycetota bacterium]|nr:HEAT repeat domain-containing protein [Actinomycetota bacterium]
MNRDVPPSRLAEGAGGLGPDHVISGDAGSDEEILQAVGRAFDENDDPERSGGVDVLDLADSDPWVGNQLPEERHRRRRAKGRRDALTRMATGELEPGDVEAAVNIMSSHPDPETRWLAAETLTRFPRIVPLSVPARALKDPDDRVRATAVRIAAAHGGPAAPLLLPLITARTWPLAQQTALNTLPHLVAAPDALAPRDVNRLVEAVAALDPPPFGAEIPGFGALARALGIDRLAEQLDAPDRRRIGAVRLLSTEGSPRSLRTVASMTGDPVEEIQWAAARAMASLETQPPPRTVPDERGPMDAEGDEAGDDEVLAALVRGLTDPEEVVRSQAIAALHRIRPGLIKRWATRALRGRDRSRNALGAAVVRHLRILDSAPLLLDVASQVPRDEAAPYLAALKAIDLEPGTLVDLLSSVDPTHRQTAVRLVWQLGGNSVLPYLPPLLDDSSGPVRMAVLEVLTESGDPSAARFAQHLLESDSSAAVRATAMQLLARRGGTARVAAMAQALRDPDPDVRATAIETLPPALSGEVAELLLSAFMDEDERVWRPTVAHLAELPERDLPLLWSAIRDAPEPKRDELLSALERYDSDRLAKLALDNAQTPDAASRGLTIHVAARAGTTESTSLVVSALEDPDPFVRRTAAAAMSTLRNPLAVQALSRALADPHAEVRVEAVRALGIIDDDSVPGALISALNDPEIRVREMAVDALGRWRSPGVARRLAATLGSPDLRATVRDVLIRMGQSAVQPLTEVAIGDDLDAALVAGEILNEIVGVTSFVTELSSTDPDARLRAVLVLGVIGGPVAAEALMTMVTDPDVRIRAQSVVLLGELGDPRAVKVLKRVFTSDPVSEVAAAAEESLRELGALAPDDEKPVHPDVPEAPPEPDGQGTFDR